MASASIFYPCGCMRSSEPGVGIVSVRLCVDHGQFSSVQQACRVLRDALEEAHQQLPPGPKAA